MYNLRCIIDTSTLLIDIHSRLMHTIESMFHTESSQWVPAYDYVIKALHTESLMFSQ